ncbi:unnamed protein product, partial [marine sediment metagenome]
FVPILAKTIDTKPSEGIFYYRDVHSVACHNLDRSGTFVLFYYYDNQGYPAW